MPSWVYILTGVGTLFTGGVGAYVLLRKFPLESRKLSVETVDVNVNIAGRLRDVAVRDWERIDAEMEDLRREFDQYRADTESRLAELGTLLRSEKAENERLRTERDEAVARVASVEREAAAEIGRLRKRVDDLEGEVRELKANGSHQIEQ